MADMYICTADWVSVGHTSWWQFPIFFGIQLRSTPPVGNSA